MEIQQCIAVPNFCKIMTLEDFFTLTEMNNGLTAPSRVRELMAIMQKDRDCVVKNSADSTRQWSAVASAVAATENKECLDLFIQLDGLHFISKWLKDAQKFSNGSGGDGIVEESISHLLRALKNLHVEYEKLVSSEICATVQDLLVHNSSKVRDEARALSESWRTNGGCDAAISDVEKSGTLMDDEPAKTAGDGSISKGTSKEKTVEMSRDDEMLSTNPDAVHADQLESTAQDSDKILDPVVIKQSSDHKGSPPLPMSTVEPSRHYVGTAVEPCSPTVSKLDALDTCTEINDIKSPPKIESSLPKLGLGEESKLLEDRILSSSSDAVDEVSSVKTSVAGEKGSCDEHLSYIDSSDKKVSDDIDDFNHPILRKEKIPGYSKDLGTGSKDDEIGDLASIYNTGKKQTSRKPGSKSGLEMDYGIFDPLEFARQVAREIVDYGEQSGGASEELPENNMQEPDSPDCISGKQSSASDADDPNLSNESSPMQQDPASSSEKLDDEPTNEMKVNEAAQEANLEKSLCDFDLNEEVFSEDPGHIGNQNVTPISTVAASRAAAAAPGLPCGPLQFEGNLGWKGSAATSAFRQLENDKDLSAGRSGSSSKQQVCLNIDLNIGESVVTREGGALQGNIFSTVLSGESSMETNSKRSEHLELDLNCASKDVSTPDCRIRQFFPHGNHSHSSSSSKQQPIRNINLNDQPSFLNDSSDDCRLSMASQKSDESVISIMGTRVELNRKDLVSPTPSLSNGLTSELAFDANLGRPGAYIGIGSALPYTHSSLYAYNNIAPAPPIPFSSTIYGSPGPFPTPYMVDSQGAPVIPQIVGSPSSLPTGFSQPPFVINMNGFTSPNGFRQWQSNFDVVNSGTFLGSAGSKEPTGLGLFLNSTQVPSVDEQLRSSHSQPSGKRKEPDNGWENYPFKSCMPPWKHS